jgi:hypothetical protein
MGARGLRKELAARGVSTEGVFEREELVRLLLDNDWRPQVDPPCPTAAPPDVRRMHVQDILLELEDRGVAPTSHLQPTSRPTCPHSGVCPCASALLCSCTLAPDHTRPPLYVQIPHDVLAPTPKLIDLLSRARATTSARASPPVPSPSWQQPPRSRPATASRRRTEGRRPRPEDPARRKAATGGAWAQVESTGPTDFGSTSGRRADSAWDRDESWDRVTTGLADIANKSMVSRALSGHGPPKHCTSKRRVAACGGGHSAVLAKRWHGAGAL